MTQQTPHELLGEDAGIRALANAFYDAMDTLPNADHIRSIHPASLTDVKQKLYEYLSGWLGGPDIYHEKYGHICLTDQHKPFTINSDDRDRWLYCFDYALEEVNASEEVKIMLKQPMFRMADFLVNS